MPDTKMFPSEVLLLSKIRNKKELRKELKKFAEKYNYAFLDMMLEVAE